MMTDRRQKTGNQLNMQLIDASGQLDKNAAGRTLEKTLR